MAKAPTRTAEDERYAAVFSALGHPVRLRIVRLLLRAHPEGLVVGDIQDKVDIPASTLTHHLESLRRAEVVVTQRESQCIRYRVSAEHLRELVGFLCAECCAETRVIPASAIRSSLTP